MPGSGRGAPWTRRAADHIYLCVCVHLLASPNGSFSCSAPMFPLRPALNYAESPALRANYYVLASFIPHHASYGSSSSSSPPCHEAQYHELPALFPSKIERGSGDFPPPVTSIFPSPFHALTREDFNRRFALGALLARAPISYIHPPWCPSHPC